MDSTTATPGSMPPADAPVSFPMFAALAAGITGKSVYEVLELVGGLFEAAGAVFEGSPDAPATLIALLPPSDRAAMNAVELALQAQAVRTGPSTRDRRHRGALQTGAGCPLATGDRQCRRLQKAARTGEVIAGDTMEQLSNGGAVAEALRVGDETYLLLTGVRDLTAVPEATTHRRARTRPHRRRTLLCRTRTRTPPAAAQETPPAAEAEPITDVQVTPRRRRGVLRRGGRGSLAAGGRRVASPGRPGSRTCACSRSGADGAADRSLGHTARGQRPPVGRPSRPVRARGRRSQRGLPPHRRRTRRRTKPARRGVRPLGPATCGTSRSPARPPTSAGHDGRWPSSWSR